jgi:hypothetical protein
VDCAGNDARYLVEHPGLTAPPFSAISFEAAAWMRPSRSRLRRCAGMRLLAAAMRRVHPNADPEKIAASAFLIWHLGEATMRLAISPSRGEGDAVVDAFKRMTLRELSEPWRDGHVAGAA